MAKIDDLADDAFTPKPETLMSDKIGSYEIDNQGVFIIVPETQKDGTIIDTRQRVSYTPFVISSLGHNIDSGEKSIELNFIDNRGRNLKEWIPTRDALSKDVLKLQARGINFAEKRKNSVNEYLSYSLFAKGNTLQEQPITKKNGWKNNLSLFVVGETSYSDKGETPIINNGDRAITDALKPHGDLENWKSAVSGLLQYDNVRFKIYGAFTAILLRLLNQQSFIIHNYDESSQGKSTMSNIAMSHIGDPKALEYSANCTQTGAERLAETYTDLPLNLDETSAAKPETLKTIVYMISNERGRARGNRDSQLRESSAWKTVTLTTGEAPITNDSTFTGAKIRVIEIFGGIGAHVPDEIVKVKGIYGSYGHVLPLFLKKLFENKKELTAKYSDYRNAFKESIKSDSGIDTRLIDTFAAITTAGYLLELVYKEIGIKAREPLDVTKEILKNTVEKRRTEKYGARALELIASWIDTKTKYFILETGHINGYGEKKEYQLDGTTDDDKIHDVYGWITKTENFGVIEEFIDILPAQLKKYLTDSGFNPERCLEDWREQKIIICSKGHFTTTQRHSFDIKRVIRFKKTSLINDSGSS